MEGREQRTRGEPERDIRIEDDVVAYSKSRGGEGKIKQKIFAQKAEAKQAGPGNREPHR